MRPIWSATARSSLKLRRSAGSAVLKNRRSKSRVACELWQHWETGMETVHQLMEKQEKEILDGEFVYPRRSTKEHEGAKGSGEMLRVSFVSASWIKRFSVCLSVQLALCSYPAFSQMSQEELRRERQETYEELRRTQD